MTHVNESLQKRLLEFVNRTDYRPQTQPELVKALHLRGHEANHLKGLLQELKRAGRLQLIPKNRWALSAPEQPLQTGMLSVLMNGGGIVTPEGGTRQDELFVPRDHMGQALTGDLVQVQILAPGDGGGRRRPPPPSATAAPLRREVRVVRILERERKNVVGLLQQQSQMGWYIKPDDPRIASDIRVRGFATGLPVPRPNLKVVVTLDGVAAVNEPLSGEVTEVLGEAGGSGVDMLSLMRDRQLRTEFPAEVVSAAEATPSVLSESDLKGRKDFRSLLTVTIDPVDAKDFDDAVTLEPLPGGEWRLYVHIADVAHFVPQGSTIDREACHRGNSVYMVDRFVPMLPKYLTADVCSLRPHVDRLAHTVIARLSPEGEILEAESVSAVIHSFARLTYEQVQAFVDGRNDHGVPPGAHDALRNMTKLSALLRRRRLAAGAIDLSMPEVKCELDAQGRAISIKKRGADQAYHLIEEFMLVANVAVAERLATYGGPAMYRIHEEPEDEQWERMAIDLQALGIDEMPRNRFDLNRLFGTVKGSPLEYAVNLAVLKNLKRAMYSSHTEQHFGLAFPRYTHFTSPIRRYPDLVVHRLLRAAEEDRKPPYTTQEVSRIALHCGETERNADEAENESLEIKRIDFYAEKLSRGDIGPHQALVVGVVPRGLIVEMTDSLQRGLVAFATMTDDFYEYQPDKARAVGRRHRNVWTLGMLVGVEIMRVDQNRRQLDFRFTGEAGFSRAPARKGDRSRGRRAPAGKKQVEVAQTPQRGRGRRHRTR